MKLTLLLMLMAISASAQQVISTLANISSETSVRYRTNSITADQVIDGVTNKVVVCHEIIEEKAPVQVIRLLVGEFAPISTNRVAVVDESLTRKPLLSAQKPDRAIPGVTPIEK